MPSGSDSYSIRAQSSSHRASELAPSWSVLYVQSSKGVTQFQWDPSLVKQWEGYSLWPIFVETGLAFWGNTSYVSGMCNGLGLQCGISSKKYAKDASFSDSSKTCQPIASWSPWRDLLWALFSSFPEETPGSRLHSSQAVSDVNCTPGSSLSTLKLFSFHWFIRAYCPLHCFLRRTLNEQARVIRPMLHQSWIYVTSDWH